MAEAPGKRRPVIPAQWQPGNIGGTIRQAAGLQAYRAAYHGIRAPAYLFLTVWYAVRGAHVLAGRLSGMVGMG